MTNATLIATIKRVAQNTSDIIKKKEKIKEKIENLEQKQREILEKKLAKLKEEYENLAQQQEIFESPIRKFTGGYGTEDLVEIKVIETGTDKNGKPIRKTVYELRYPDTVIPPSEVPTKEGEPEEASKNDVSITPSQDTPTEFVPMEADSDDIPFS